MVVKWPFLKLKFPKLKHTLAKIIIDFDPIRVQTCLALQNDRQILNFVKDIYVVGKKPPEMIAKVPDAKVVLFISNQSLNYID